MLALLRRGGCLWVVLQMRPAADPAVVRRRLLQRLVCCGWVMALWLGVAGGWAQAQGVPDDLMLYGVRLKGVSSEAFIQAAVQAGAVPLPVRVGEPLSLDTRQAGVPALQRLTVIRDEAGLVSAQFVIKPYGQDNEALRQLLVIKYGVPSTAEGARRPFPAFAARFAPRGSFDWDFAGGMKLIYRQPALGDATLSYTDVERARRLSAAAPTSGASAAGALVNRF